VLEAMREWQRLYGRLPSSYDWSRTHAGRRGGEALRRLEAGVWPSASVVTKVFGSWAAAREATEPRPQPLDIVRRAEPAPAKRTDVPAAWTEVPGISVDGVNARGVARWAQLRRVRAPTLVIRGTDSEHLSAQIAARMVRAIPGARLITLPGDHWVHRQPEPYVAAVAQFLKGDCGA
jgi:pimeloyl-ACP methyl ester carboxylesterase